EPTAVARQYPRNLQAPLEPRAPAAEPADETQRRDGRSVLFLRRRRSGPGSYPAHSSEVHRIPETRTHWARNWDDPGGPNRPIHRPWPRYRAPSDEFRAHRAEWEWLHRA